MAAMMSQLPPPDARWMPISELDTVVSEYWGETGTTIMLLRVGEDSEQSNRNSILRVLRSQGIFAVPQESSIHEAVERGEVASTFLESLPQRPG